MHEGEHEGEQDRPEREDRKAEEIRRNEGIGDERAADPALALGQNRDLPAGGCQSAIRRDDRIR
jgi:hypothetical protein